jgi:hypothetical protein
MKMNFIDFISLGGCSKVLGAKTVIADFSPAELPMSDAAWSSNLNKNHPLCDMTGTFVNNTIKMHSVNMNKLFISFDGRGDVSDLLSMGAVFSSILDKSKNSNLISVDKKFLDMFLAMNSRFFVLNPRSTFSWQVYLIRLCLGLESVPILKNKDVYVDNEQEYGGLKGLWVGWLSVVEAYNDIVKTL